MGVNRLRRRRRPHLLRDCPSVLQPGRAMGPSEAALAARTVLHPGPAPQDSDRIAAATTEGCHYYRVCPKTVRRGVAWMERSKIQESARQRKAPETEIDTEIEWRWHCLCLTSVSRVTISHPLLQPYDSMTSAFFMMLGNASTRRPS